MTQASVSMCKEAFPHFMRLALNLHRNHKTFTKMVEASETGTLMLPVSESYDQKFLDSAHAGIRNSNKYFMDYKVQFSVIEAKNSELSTRSKNDLKHQMRYCQRKEFHFIQRVLILRTIVLENRPYISHQVKNICLS